MWPFFIALFHFIVKFMRVSNLCDTMNPWYWLAIPLLVFQSEEENRRPKKNQLQVAKKRILHTRHAVFIHNSLFLVYVRFENGLTIMSSICDVYCSCCAYNSYRLADSRIIAREAIRWVLTAFVVCVRLSECFCGLKTINRAKPQQIIR